MSSSNKSPDLKGEGSEMKKKDASELLSVYLVLFLTLIAGLSLFMFIINWEDWFFGIKLDGWPAGLYLFLKVVVAALLAYLLVKHENKRILWSILSIVFFAFVFILPVFSSQRNLRDELSWMIFWIEFVIMIIIPVILLVIFMRGGSIQRGGLKDNTINGRT
jgi:ABC-type glycerol-3-phosphate transport system permease component